MASIVVTLDVGGSGVKASAFDVDSRVTVGSVVGRYSTPASGAEEGTFDPESWWGTAIEAGRLLVEKVGRPPMEYLGVTVSAIRGPFVMLDRKGDTLGPCLLNRDPRAGPQVRRIVDSLGEFGLYEATGHWGSTKFGLPKMLWVRDTYPRTLGCSYHNPSAPRLVHLPLSGIVASEPSSAAMSQCLEVSGGNWKLRPPSRTENRCRRVSGVVPGGHRGRWPAAACGQRVGSSGRASRPSRRRGHPFLGHGGRWAVRACTGCGGRFYGAHAACLRLGPRQREHVQHLSSADQPARTADGMGSGD